MPFKYKLNWCEFFYPSFFLIQKTHSHIEKIVNYQNWHVSLALLFVELWSLQVCFKIQDTLVHGSALRRIACLWSKLVRMPLYKSAYYVTSFLVCYLQWALKCKQKNWKRYHDKAKSKPVNLISNLEALYKKAHIVILYWSVGWTISLKTKLEFVFKRIPTKLAR